MTWLFVDVMVLLVIPFSLHRGTDNLWAQPPRLAFLGLSILAANVFGMLGAVFADRQGRSAWWFLAGHLGAWVAPALVISGFFESEPFISRLIVLGSSALGGLFALIAVNGPPRQPTPPGRFTQLLGTLLYRTGSIKLGIVLMALLVVALGTGTQMENLYGGRAAKAIVYTSGWLSLVFVLFTACLASATLRKYPWRLDQAGWLAIHSALLILVVGAFLTFWGKKEGSLELVEGGSTNQFRLSTETRLEVFDGRGKKIWSAIASFDRNPAKIHPNQRFEVTRNGAPLFAFTVDRYFGTGKQVLHYSNDNPQPVGGVRLTTITNSGEHSVILQEGRPRFPLGEFLKFRTLGHLSDARYDALISGNLSPAKGMVIDFAYRGEGEWFAVLHGGTMKPRRMPLVKGKKQQIGPQFGFRVDEFFTHLRGEVEWQFEAYAPEKEVARLQIEGEGEPRWLNLTDSRLNHTALLKGDEQFQIAWVQGTNPLGFDLKLIDFHRDFYPGSMVAKTYESHLILRHPRKFPDGAEITIDMNHPLVLDGWRLYQHRFGAGGGRESTILQVNTDPGLGATYFGCILLGLGLVVAFFQKPYLRAKGRLLKARGAPAVSSVLQGLLTIALCALGILPGMLVFWGLEEGPIMLLGVLAVILGLIVETRIVTHVLKARAEAQLAALKTPAGEF